MADVPASLASWNVAEGSNLPVGSTSIVNLDENLRTVQSVVRYLYNNDTIASAATTDLGSKESGLVGISGTTTITSLGTIAQGIRKWVYFTGVLVLTHNATSLILPTAANITTAAGDCAQFVSLGGGNWRCLVYSRASGQNVAGSTLFADGTVGAPSVTFTLDTDTGLYRIGANNLGLSIGGTKRVDFSATAVQFVYGATSSIGSAISLLSAAGSNVLIAGGDSALPSNAGNVTIQAGSHTQGGSGHVRGDLTLSAGAQTFVSGATGDRGGDVTIAAGACADPNNAAVSGTIRLRIGSAGSNATPGSVRVQDGGGTDLLVVSANRKTVAMGGAAPTISSGAGSGATIAGKGNAFHITFGTGAGTTVVVNLPTPVQGTGAFANAPVVVANYETSNIAVRASASVTQITLTFASAPANGGICHVICLGYE